MPMDRAAADTLAHPDHQAEFLLYRLYRIHVTAGRKVVQMCDERHGITRREWRVLSFLAENEGVPSSELAERAMLDRARTSRTLTALADKQLIERRPKPSDRREVHIFLSERGRAVHDDVFPRIAAINRELVAELSAEERAVLDRAVARIQATADRMLAGAPPLARDNPDDEP
ncbi:MAG: MarR family transcriptional regulator [Hydrogenophaga sp.]|uniref:MarR family winged helix-turn-helix transcriptional regulator n=1 Tax=Hydrogenophaga sp. TaxID=1904254 RepID=UPI001DAB74C4|nr:MarR family transcriptional regulator [Hydrogenophaga sp.]MBX3608801.1 MarR family transcriptional regulator [Hydrogenophaga sp.]